MVLPLVARSCYARAGDGRTATLVSLPRLPEERHPRRVRSDGWRDRVSVRLLHGQCAEHYATQADALAHSFGARSCRVRAYRPRRLWLDLIYSDPLAALLRVPALTDPDAGVDLARMPVGRTETGRAWVLRLLDRHVPGGPC